ncbi:DUF1304 domain-containing protein [Janibacter hoylei]|uniref:DUF1304 domain-containing protein n=1 Tax=Janibacter hoylei TaxID=364298 RepID=UPI0021A4E98E|nr:DUF1304 domain-containing protein [Janibacter hoylei]MCT1619191.1 DUF1304 domain-containing protein [Janibacter hoylei]MCT2293377.1 DUF1304 domain-containing protein [Janibacter hoylei]
MIWVGLAVAGCAAALHVFIFYLESFAWTTRARGVFGTSVEEAQVTRELAFNQGFYNLFLAIVVALGIVVHAVGHEVVGLTLVLTGVGSMLAASLVLLLSSPDKARAAVNQGVLPALAIALLVAGLAL